VAVPDGYTLELTEEEKEQLLVVLVGAEAAFRDGGISLGPSQGNTRCRSSQVERVIIYASQPKLDSCGRGSPRVKARCKSNCRSGRVP
jgi:hypothetical protein